jgi:uncharacterized protein with GYD domain
MVARPEDRSKAARKLIEEAGGKFIASYFTFGDYDFAVICEFDSPQKMTPAVIAAAAGGSLTDMKTTVGMTWDDAKAAFAASEKLAEGFRSAGTGK